VRSRPRRQGGSIGLIDCCSRDGGSAARRDEARRLFAQPVRRHVRLTARTDRKHKVAGMGRPFQIRMGGYGPATTCFSLALKMIGDRLTAEFGDDVDVKYVWNIMDLGYRAEDILWLVEHGLLTLGYQSSSYLTDRVPALGIVDFPFLFRSNSEARGAMDGQLGDILAREIEARVNYRILGWFENGFRHVSNRLRPVHTPADLAGMRIRVLPSQVQAKTFELLGAIPLRWDLTEAITAIKAGTIDAQENPFANTVTYGVHNYHRYHTLTNHFYISRPIFLNRTAFDGWPERLQRAMREAVAAAVRFQRELAVVEDRQARAAIEEKHCEIVELESDQHDAFAAAVKPIYGDARKAYAPEILDLVPRPI
jgi:TRAP-type C4-dicarboxylate transport system substrate-binding protein